jgi:hypothetical protein
MQPHRSSPAALWRPRASLQVLRNTFLMRGPTPVSPMRSSGRASWSHSRGDCRLGPNDLTVCWRAQRSVSVNGLLSASRSSGAGDSSAHLRGQPSISINTGVRTSIFYDLLDPGAQFQGVSTGNRLRTVLPTFKHGIAITPSLEDPTADIP